jgi:hypothetical protein
MNVSANRAVIGFGAETPNGKWYDSDYTPKLNVYTARYDVWATPATSTRLALDNLKDAENDFFPLYRQFYGMMKTSALVPNSYLEEMGFPPRPSGGREPHPVDKLFIDLNIIPLANGIVNAAFENRDTGSSIIPYYLTGAVLYYAVGDAPVTDPNLLPLSRLATRSPFELVLEQSQRGKTLTMAARWQNERGELGPWSELVTSIVP